eukprot:TRINITY_DN4039_c0_g1_i1.p1 TRINITY_DN4039_c0_g1~~TRINITY_DN4039_c0_g1_i1.p1  ORF type:complete len:143 (-),score=20.37 TRINITY_DN4039_c0_g1_i1:42-449(-)
MTTILRDIVGKATKKIPNGKNLFDLMFKERNYGIGNKFSRKTWRHWGDSSYWTVTRVVPTTILPAQNRGKAWGKLTWRGVTDTEETEIRGVHKREWRQVNQDAKLSSTSASQDMSPKTTTTETASPPTTDTTAKV